jgi:aminoglycoside 3-N-acetyltransferase I
MGDSFAIRVVQPRELAIMRAMLAMFGEAFEDRESYTSSQPDDDYLRSLLAGEAFVAVVAMREDEVVGGLAAYFLRKFEQARSELYIYDLAVAEAHRRKGLATAMIEELRSVAASRGAYVIFVQADHGDDPAIALYTKMGKREDVLHFDIEPRRSR